MAENQLARDLRQHLFQKLTRNIDDTLDTAKIGGLDRIEMAPLVLYTLIRLAAGIAGMLGISKHQFMVNSGSVYEEQNGKG